MGAELSHQSPPPPPPRVVLVPPFFQRDVRGLSRFCRSSFDYLGNRKELERLLRDHLSPELRGMLLLSPPDDPRVSVRAKLRPSGGSMLLRWQPASAASLHTFIEMGASLDSPGDVYLRGSYLHPTSGLGAFMWAPLARNLSGKAAQVGVRYSCSSATAGAIFVPRRGELDKLWLAGRMHGWTLGLQLSPELPVRQSISALLPPLPPRKHATSAVAAPTADGRDVIDNSSAPTNAVGSDGFGSISGCSLEELKSWFRSHGSVLLSYSPPPRNGAGAAPFTASVHLKEGGDLTFSFFQHIAATRQVVNPFEQDEVVGITNYLDIGLQMTTALGSGSLATPSSAPLCRKAQLLSTTATSAGHCVPATSGSGGGPRAGSATAAPAASARGQGWGGAGGAPASPKSPKSSTGAAAAMPDPVGSKAAAQPATIDLAASWQINKNWLIKGRVGSHGAAAAVGARVWHAVSAYLTASVAVEYSDLSKPRYGVELCVENFGHLRYERGTDDVAAGRALLQRHEASRQDLDNFAGKGVLVRRSAQAGADSGSSGGDGSSGSRQQELERRRVAELL